MTEAISVFDSFMDTIPNGILIIFLALISLLFTYYKPKFWWESRKVKRFRKTSGDKETVILCYLVSTALFILGIFRLL